MNILRRKIKIFIMDKSFETLKEYESAMNKLYPKDKKEYLTHYSDLEKLIKDDAPDIVILDGDSPYWMITAKRIKEMNSKVKVIISASREKIALESYQTGINGFLKKPFTIETIKKTMNNAE